MPSAAECPGPYNDEYASLPLRGGRRPATFGAMRTLPSALAALTVAWAGAAFARPAAEARASASEPAGPEVIGRVLFMTSLPDMLGASGSLVSDWRLGPELEAGVGTSPGHLGAYARAGPRMKLVDTRRGEPKGFVLAVSGLAGSRLMGLEGSPGGYIAADVAAGIEAHWWRPGSATNVPLGVGLQVQAGAFRFLNPAPGPGREWMTEWQPQGRLVASLALRLD